jgi:mono/diheme cytochrome c family protein
MKNRFTLATVGFSLIILPSSFILLCGCGTPRRDEPLAGPLRLDDPKLVTGQQVFMHNCYQCHPGGSAGLGPPLNDKPLPGFAIRTQVRKGLGAMPAFDPKMIPEEDLDHVLAYLKALRAHKSG